MPRHYVHYILIEKDVDLNDALQQILNDPLVTGELPKLLAADIQYENRPRQVYRLTQTPRMKRSRETVPEGQRGKWRKPKVKSDDG